MRRKRGGGGRAINGWTHCMWNSTILMGMQPLDNKLITRALNLFRALIARVLADNYARESCFAFRWNSSNCRFKLLRARERFFSCCVRTQFNCIGKFDWSIFAPFNFPFFFFLNFAIVIFAVECLSQMGFKECFI